MEEHLNEKLAEEKTQFKTRPWYIRNLEYSPEYIDKNQSFPPDKFEFDFFSFKIEGKKVTICILENTTGKSRSIKFICRHVNTYHAITVVQLPDINIIEHSGN